MCGVHSALEARGLFILSDDATSGKGRTNERTKAMCVAAFTRQPTPAPPSYALKVLLN